MQIDFGSSGGFANLELAYRVDTDTLPEGQAKELENLIESSGAFEIAQDDLPPNPKAGAGPPDVIAYRLSLSEGTRQNTLWFNDVTTPASIRPLLAYLRKLAIEEKKNGPQTN